MSDVPTVTITFTPDGKKGLGTAMARFPDGATETDRINITRRKARLDFVALVCRDREGVDEDAVRLEMERLAAVTATEAAEQSAPPAVSRGELLAARDAQTAAALAETPRDILDEAEGMLGNPRLLDIVLRDIRVLGVVGEEELAVTSYLLGTSRLLDKPLSAIVQGLSATGKSFVPDSVSTLFPPEAVLRATDITANALYYGEPELLIHRAVFAGERPRVEDDDRSVATKAMREMLASGVLHKMVTAALPGGKGFQTLNIRREGPIAFIESTTKAQIFDEDANRSLLIGTDESPEHTANIVAHQGEAAAGRSFDTSRFVLLHHALQRLLKRVHVIVPFGPALAKAIPTGHQNARRAMPHIISTVRAVTLLNQRQRQPGAIEHSDEIVALGRDYAVARRLLMGPMGRALGQSLPQAAANFGRRLQKRYGDQEFDTAQVRKDDPVVGSRSKVNEYLAALAEVGVTERLQKSEGGKPSVWKNIGAVPEGGALWLPDLAALGIDA